MTTQAESPHPPAHNYSTSPPWASPPAATAESPPRRPVALPAYGDVAPYGSPLPEHGQLLVRFPDEMQHASRTSAPSWWPIAPLTFLFVIPGVISATRRAAQARRTRNSAAPYWITLIAALVVSFFAWDLIFAVGLPVYLNIRESAATKTVQEQIVRDGQLTSKTRLTASSASCDPTGPRAADGLRAYSCLLKLDDGRTGTIDVTADTDGNWTAVPLTGTAQPAKK